MSKETDALKVLQDEFLIDCHKMGEHEALDLCAHHSC